MAGLKSAYSIRCNAITSENAREISVYEAVAEAMSSLAGVLTLS